MSDPRPLAGLRVLDISRLLPGPFASMLLADLGAEVIKVEDPKAGDYLRVMPLSAPGQPNVVFEALNRGKKSVVLDLKKPAGREALLALVRTADVLLESFRPGVLARLGLGPDTLRDANAQLITCAISGYGQDGPLKARAGHDLNYLARGGVLGMTGPAGGAPQVPGVQLADLSGGLYAVIAVLAELQGRAARGEGRALDISMCEASLSLGIFGLGLAAGGALRPRGEDMLMGGIAPYGTYRTRDGGFVALAALEPKFWMAFCAGVGLTPDLADVRPGPHQAARKAELASLFATRTRDEWAAFSEAHDCCLEPVLMPQELPGDPLHVARGVFEPRRLGDAEVSIPRTPVAPPAPGPAPEQGADTEAVLRAAGVDVEALRAAGATR
ncbi:MAG: CaiB/BaiF CoA-transferase family protein [Myxococcota bacterium]